MTSKIFKCGIKNQKSHFSPKSTSYGLSCLTVPTCILDQWKLSGLKYQPTFPIILDFELDGMFFWTGPTGFVTAGLPHAPVATSESHDSWVCYKAESVTFLTICCCLLGKFSFLSHGFLLPSASSGLIFRGDGKLSNITRAVKLQSMPFHLQFVSYILVFHWFKICHINKRLTMWRMKPTLYNWLQELQNVVF